MPIESGVFQQSEAMSGYLLPNDIPQGHGQQNHPNDYMQTVQAGDDIIEPKKNVKPRLSEHQRIRIWINILGEFRAPLKILVDQKDESTKYREKKK